MMVLYKLLVVIIGLAPAALCSVMHLSSLQFKHNVLGEGKVSTAIRDSKGISILE